KHRQSCSPERCVFAPGSALYDLAASTGMAEQTGGLLTSVGMNLNGATNGLPNSVAFIRLISAHPAASAILAAVYRHNEDAPYLAALFAQPLTEDTARLAASAVGPRDGGADYWNGWYDAFIEAAEHDAASAPAIVRAGIAQLALRRKFELGLTA